MLNGLIFQLYNIFPDIFRVVALSLANSDCGDNVVLYACYLMHNVISLYFHETILLLVQN